MVSKKGLSSGAKAGIGVAASFGSILLLGGLLLCVLGARRRNSDLGHLAWINKRGTIRGRSEAPGREEAPVDARELGLGVGRLDGKGLRRKGEPG